MATNSADATMTILVDVQLSQEGFMDASDKTYAPKTTKNPDYIIDREVFDTYSPISSSVRNMYSQVKRYKIDSKQTENIVLNISDTKVTLDQVRKQFTDWPMEGLKQLLVIDKDSSLIKIF